jgi:hypothetical protein
MYWYIPSTYFFCYSCTELLSFLKAMYILTEAEYVLRVPDSISCLPGQACLLAKDSGTRLPIEPNHTQEGLFTSTPLKHPTRHALLLVSWLGCRCSRSFVVGYRRCCGCGGALSSAPSAGSASDSPPPAALPSTRFLCLKCLGLVCPLAQDID